MAHSDCSNDDMLHWASWAVTGSCLLICQRVRNCDGRVAAFVFSFCSVMSANGTVQCMYEAGDMPLQLIMWLPADVKLCTE